jgi:hypothetical protein
LALLVIWQQNKIKTKKKIERQAAGRSPSGVSHDCQREHYRVARPMSYFSTFATFFADASVRGFFPFLHLIKQRTLDGPSPCSSTGGMICCRLTNRR